MANNQPNTAFFTFQDIKEEHHVSCGPLDTCPPEYAKTLEQKHGTLLKEAAGAQAHTAYLIIPNDTVIASPMHVVRHTQEVLPTHLLVIVGARSHVTIVEELRSVVGDHTMPMQHAVELFCDDESNVNFVSLNFLDTHDQLNLQQRSSVASGASVTWNNVTLGSKQTHHNLVSHVVGDHGTSGVNWLFYAKSLEDHVLTVRNIFDAHDGSGEILMKGVAEGTGHVNCQGLIDIGLQGGGTDTYLTQDVLMLDKTAKVDAIPGLEIKTNDVKASHSATVSRVTEEDLFYFAARGIDSEHARGMYVQGFLSDLTKHLDENTGRTIIAAVEDKFARPVA